MIFQQIVSILTNCMGGSVDVILDLIDDLNSSKEQPTCN